MCASYRGQNSVYFVINRVQLNWCPQPSVSSFVSILLNCCCLLQCALPYTLCSIAMLLPEKLQHHDSHLVWPQLLGCQATEDELGGKSDIIQWSTHCTVLACALLRYFMCTIFCGTWISWVSGFWKCVYHVNLFVHASYYVVGWD